MTERSAYTSKEVFASKRAFGENVFWTVFWIAFRVGVWNPQETMPHLITKHMIFNTKLYDQAGQPLLSGKLCLKWHSATFLTLQHEHKGEKIRHHLEYSKECNANSEEFPSKVSEIPWAMRYYLASKEQVEYRITGKKKLQNEKEITKKNLKNRLENGNIFNSDDFFGARA